MKYKKGIALLVTMITVSALLLISFVVANIATKQLLLGYKHLAIYTLVDRDMQWT